MTQTTETRYVIEREGRFRYLEAPDFQIADYDEIQHADLYLAPPEFRFEGRVRKVTVTTTYVIEGE